MSRKNKPMNLETSLEEIRLLVKKMEQGDLSLEESLNCFETGISLIKSAQKMLQNAEQKVQILLKDQDTLEDELKSYKNSEE